MSVNERECEAAGVDVKQIQAIERALRKAVKQANSMGVSVFGGSGSLSLRFMDDPIQGDLILASVGGNISGGCGATYQDDDGLERGEI